VGHSVTLHGCEIEDDCLIAMGAVVLSGARIRSGAIVGAGALVPEGMEVPPDSLVLGVPAKVRRLLNPADRERISSGATHYVRLAREYKEESI
jgi:carbonic anhydrase/acetyltransferase-like protein (isoleucine patch superfamily)